MESMLGLSAQIRTFQWNQDVVVEGIRTCGDGHYKTWKYMEVTLAAEPSR